MAPPIRILHDALNVAEHVGGLEVLDDQFSREFRGCKRRKAERDREASACGFQLVTLRRHNRAADEEVVEGETALTC